MKQSEIKKLSDSDLQEEIVKQTTALSELKMAHTVSPLENPSQLRSTRRTIARLQTELGKRQDK